MASSVDLENDRIVVIQNDHIVFDTNRKSVFLIPSAKLTLGPLSVVFPDPPGRIGYFYDTTSGVSICVSYATRIGGEWGPGLANDLPATLLGTVPSGTNFLDVRAYLARSSAPSQRLGHTIQVRAPENKWINLVGGSCWLEGVDSPIYRGFDVVLSGTSVYLRRFQTVYDGVVESWTADQDMGSGHHPTFIHSGGSNSDRGIIMGVIQHKPMNDGGSPLKNQTGSNACSTTDPYNYGATYTVYLTITPGRRS